MRLLNARLVFLLSVLAVATALCAQPWDSQDSQSSEAKARRAKIHAREMQVSADIVGTIPKRLAESKGDIEAHCLFNPEDSVGFPPELELINAICSSDLVVTGMMRSHAAHLTEDETFVYTDWGFVVDEILLNNEKEPADHGGEIIVAVPGGTLELDGGTVRASCREYADVSFEVNKEYLLFLYLHPSSGTYSLKAPFGFSFSGESASGLQRRVRGDDWKPYDREHLLSSARIRAGYALSGCRRRKQ